jgi:hypothetical protein
MGSKLSALSILSVPALEDRIYGIDDPSGTPLEASIVLSRLGGKLSQVCHGRLTLESGVPISTSDQSAKTTVYFTPYGGELASVYDGTRWVLYEFAELSLALGTITSGAIYDVFLWETGGALALKMGPAWTTATAGSGARGTGAGTTELELFDGVWVNKVAITSGPEARAGRYLGTFMTTSTTTTEDSLTKRFLWNAYSRVLRPLRRIETTNSWTYNSATWRYANNSSSNRVEIVVGLPGVYADIVVYQSLGTDDNENAPMVGIGLNVSNALATGASAGGIRIEAADPGPTMYATVAANFRHIPAIGYHFYSWIERMGGATTGTFFGDENWEAVTSNSQIGGFFSA